jgi:hypothetical protein
MRDLEWVEGVPPEEETRTSWEECAERLRENPKRWAHIQTFPKEGRRRAKVLEKTLRRGNRNGWTEGDFEVACRLVNEEWWLFARFVGSGE